MRRWAGPIICMRYYFCNLPGVGHGPILWAAIQSWLRFKVVSTRLNFDAPAKACRHPASSAPLYRGHFANLFKTSLATLPPFSTQILLRPYLPARSGPECLDPRERSCQLYDANLNNFLRGKLGPPLPKTTLRLPFHLPTYLHQSAASDSCCLQVCHFFDLFLDFWSACPSCSGFVV